MAAGRGHIPAATPGGRSLQRVAPLQGCIADSGGPGWYQCQLCRGCHPGIYSLLARSRRSLQHLGFKIYPTCSTPVAVLYRHDGTEFHAPSYRCPVATPGVGLRCSADGQYQPSICRAVTAGVYSLLAGERHTPVFLEHKISSICKTPVGATYSNPVNGY